MARSTYDNHFRGVVGDKVHYKRKGKYFARMRRDEINVSTTEDSLTSRLKLKSVSTLSAEMKYVTTDTFPHRNKKRSAGNEFTRLNYDCCTVEDVESETVTFDYDNLTFSKGRLMPPTVSVTFTNESKELSFTAAADTSTNCEGCRSDDKLMATVVNMKYRIAFIVELGTRGEGGMTTQTLNPMWEKEDLHVYVFAKNASGTDVSTSLHATIE